MANNLKQDSDIVEVIQDAVAEANRVKEDLRAGKDGYDKLYLSEELIEKHREIMSAAEKEISEEYKSQGTLSGNRVCEINRGMDDYALTMNDIMMLIEKADGNK